MPSPQVSRARRSLRELAETALDLLCPPTCVACGTGTAGSPICELCADRLHAPSPPLCRRCGSPLAAANLPCPQPHDFLRGIRWARHALAYRGTGGAIVRRLKFLHDRGAAVFLARGMAAAIASRTEGMGRRCMLVSVPLHPRKLRRRGMDQAAMLAEQVGQRLGIGYLPHCLGRLRDTLPQGDVRVTSRKENVAGAFYLRRPKVLPRHRVILVDDVYTSGSTARECARLLRAGGCAEVILLTAVRA